MIVPEPRFYSGPDATPEEADRERALAALTGDAEASVFVRCWIAGADLRVGIEATGGLDVDDIKTLLRKTLAAMP